MFSATSAMTAGRNIGSTVALATTAAVLVFGVLYGVLVAIGLSILELLRRIARAHDAVLGFVPGGAGMHDVDDYPEAYLVPGLLVYRYDARCSSRTPRTSVNAP